MENVSKKPNTVALLAASILSGKSSQVSADLYAAFVGSAGQPSYEAEEWFNTNKGRTVTVKGTNYSGTVDSLNTERQGLYSGCRYPINVRLDATSFHMDKCMEGVVFEYSIDQLELV